MIIKKFINPWNTKKGTTYFTLTDKQKVFSDGNYAIYRVTEKHFIHTYKNLAIGERVAPNKDMFINLREHINTDDYFNYQRPKKYIEQYQDKLK